VSVTGSSAAVETDVLAARGPAPSSSAEVLAALVRDYPGLTETLVRRLGNRPLALDVLQDAVETTLHKLQSGTSVAPDVLAGYVMRTAMNHLRNRRRRERAWTDDTAALDSCADEAASPLEDSQRDATRRLVRRVLAGLPSPRDREVLVRFYLDEQDSEQICAALGLSALQFNQVVFRARERMRRGLEQVGLRRLDVLVILLAVLASTPIG
jgi:RNA polymerase sigma-70 factor (ECF subfamily)